MPFSASLFAPRDPHESDDQTFPVSSPLPLQPDFLARLLQHLTASADSDQAHATMTLPFYDSNKNALTLEATVNKYRQAPAQPSAKLTFSHKF